MKYLCIIQARIDSTRLPGKSLMTVGGIPMVKRVWMAAKATGHKTIVAWSDRYADLKEDNVLERFRRIANEFTPDNIIRLTSDCPLLTKEDIENAIYNYETSNWSYYSNHYDGHDVQICTLEYLFRPIFTHREHVFNDFTTPNTGLSVNTKEDLERVRQLCKTK